MSCSSDPRVYVFISGPGSSPKNIRAAVCAANEIALLGAYPYVPHLGYFWDYLYVQPYTFWMVQARAWLEQCDVLYRLPGYSKGADEEIQHAVSLGIPVVDNMASLRSEIIRIRTQKGEAQEDQGVV